MNYKKIISAILLISDGPVAHNYFEEHFKISKKELFNLYTTINSNLRDNDFGFEINFNDIEADLLTLESVTVELKDFKPPSLLRGLSTPALETLSIVAYEQPVTKLKVSEIRGVESESSLKTLEARGLITKSGNLDVPGSPHLYVTTKLFLEKLNIASLNELPVLGDYFHSPNEEE